MSLKGLIFEPLALKNSTVITASSTSQLNSIYVIMRMCSNHYLDGLTKLVFVIHNFKILLQSI